eukprot:TRINITY_DN5779_c0_g1_i1.p1 TRINITY_DN5779_c0_g1~~TRINITY_DN5779_c0_g1_i1.p1  ORF type:complete len:270 (+),score=115.03 TRINITY_DN5779_c0_g1_i1:86-811(+)
MGDADPWRGLEEPLHRFQPQPAWAAQAPAAAQPAEAEPAAVEVSSIDLLVDTASRGRIRPRRRPREGGRQQPPVNIEALTKRLYDGYSRHRARYSQRLRSKYYCDGSARTPARKLSLDEVVDVNHRMYTDELERREEKRRWLRQQHLAKKPRNRLDAAILAASAERLSKPLTREFEEDNRKLAMKLMKCGGADVQKYMLEDSKRLPASVVDGATERLSYCQQRWMSSKFRAPAASGPSWRC